MNRPNELSDRLWDFGTNTSLSPLVFSMSVDKTSFNGYISTNGSTYGVSDYINITGNQSAGYFNDLTGKKVTNGIFIQYIPNYNYGYYVFAGKTILGPGLNQDDIKGYAGDSGSISVVPDRQIDSASYQYMIFQQAVPIIYNVTSGANKVIMTNGLILNQNTEDILTFDVSQTRGADISKVLTIQTVDINNNYISATVGVDYSIISGTLTPVTSNNVQIKFLRGTQYRLSLAVEGFNSNNNPYSISSGNQNRSLINDNSGAVTFYVYTVGAPVTNLITLPQLDAVITPVYQTATTPITTYSNSPVTISSTLDTTNASWIVVDNNTQVQTPKTLTDDDWYVEIAAICNITCEVRNRATNVLLFTPLIGFGPFNIVAANGDYNVQFILTKR